MKKFAFAILLKKCVAIFFLVAYLAQQQKVLAQPMAAKDKQELQNRLLMLAEQRKQKASEIAGIFATLGYGPQAAQQGATKPQLPEKYAKYGN